MNSCHNFGFFELHVFRRIDRHLEIRQDVLRYLKVFFERLIAHSGNNLPISQYWRLRQFQFAAEDSMSHRWTIPLFDTISIPILVVRTNNSYNVYNFLFKNCDSASSGQETNFLFTTKKLTQEIHLQ